MWTISTLIYRIRIIFNDKRLFLYAKITCQPKLVTEKQERKKKNRENTK